MDSFDAQFDDPADTAGFEWHNDKGWEQLELPFADDPPDPPFDQDAPLNRLEGP